MWIPRKTSFSVGRVAGVRSKGRGFRVKPAQGMFSKRDCGDCRGKSVTRMDKFFGKMNNDQQADLVAKLTGKSKEELLAIQAIVNEAGQRFVEVWRKACAKGAEIDCDASHLMPTLLGASIQVAISHIEYSFSKDLSNEFKTDLLRQLCFALMDSIALEKPFRNEKRDFSEIFRDQAPPFSQN